MIKNNENGITSIIVLGALAGVFITSTGVVVASNSSKPGDALYSIDRKAESLQLALAVTDSLKKDAHKTFAEERLQEVQAMLTEKDIDAPGIANALNNFEEHKAKIADLSDDDGNLDDQEKKLTSGLDDKKSSIDKLFEGQQKSLENQREALKKQYEQALKNGDTVKAAALKAQIDSFEEVLKAAEQKREIQKQDVEEQSEAVKEAEEAEKKAAEEMSEAEKKALEQQREAEKKALEQED